MELETETQFEANGKKYNLKLVVTEQENNQKPQTNGLVDLFSTIFSKFGNKEKQNKERLKPVMDKIVEYIQANTNESEERRKEQQPKINELVNAFTNLLGNNQKPTGDKVNEFLKVLIKSGDHFGENKDDKSPESDKLVGVIESAFKAFLDSTFDDKNLSKKISNLCDNSIEVIQQYEVEKSEKNSKLENKPALEVKINVNSVLERLKDL